MKWKSSCMNLHDWYTGLWLKFAQILHALSHVDDNMDIEPQAVEIQTLATEFGTMWSKHMPADSGGVYLHVLVRTELSTWVAQVHVLT